MYAVLFVSTVLLCFSVIVTGEDVPVAPPEVPLVLIQPDSGKEPAKPEALTENAAKPEAPAENAAIPEAPAENAAKPEAPAENAAIPEAPSEIAAKPEAPAENGAIPIEQNPPILLTNQTVESVGPVVFSADGAEASNVTSADPETGNDAVQIVPNSVDSEIPTLSERKQQIGDILGISPDKIGNGLGSSCKSNSDCKLENSVCQDQSCLCKDGHRASKLKLEACVRKPKALGDSCEDNAECDLVASNSVCTDNICQCSGDFIADQGACWELKGLGVACETNIQCNEIQNASCLQGVCACPSDHVPSPVSNKCLLVATSYLSECLEDIQCTESMGDNGRCYNNECICKDDYHYNRTACIPDLKLGSPCGKKEDCTVSLATEPAGQRTCLNNNCTCATGFRVMKGEDNCVKGVADQISISLSWMVCVIIAKYFI